MMILLEIGEKVILIMSSKKLGFLCPGAVQKVKFKNDEKLTHQNFE